MKKTRKYRVACVTSLAMMALISGCGGSSSGSSVGLDSEASQPADISDHEAALKRVIVATDFFGGGVGANALEDLIDIPDDLASGELDGILSNAGVTNAGDLPGTLACDSGQLIVDLLEQEEYPAGPGFVDNDAYDTGRVIFNSCQFDDNGDSERFDGLIEFGLEDAGDLEADFSTFVSNLQSFYDDDKFVLQLGNSSSDRYTVRETRPDFESQVEIFARQFFSIDARSIVGELHLREQEDENGERTVNHTLNLLPRSGEDNFIGRAETGDLDDGTRGRVQLARNQPIDEVECGASGNFEFEVTENIDFDGTTLLLKPDTGAMTISSDGVEAVVEFNAPSGEDFAVTIDGTTEFFTDQQYDNLIMEVYSDCLGVVMVF